MRPASTKDSVSFATPCSMARVGVLLCSRAHPRNYPSPEEEMAYDSHDEQEGRPEGGLQGGERTGTTGKLKSGGRSPRASMVTSSRTLGYSPR